MSASHSKKTNSKPQANTTTADERQILAERYKTKQCKNYVATGTCPYETRCMFAHGDADLRTTEANLRDGLTTEEAIKAHQHHLSAKRRHGTGAGRHQRNQSSAKPASAAAERAGTYAVTAPADAPCAATYHPATLSAHTYQGLSPRSSHRDDGHYRHNSSSGLYGRSPASPGWYVHDPYAPMLLAPEDCHYVPAYDDGYYYGDDEEVAALGYFPVADFEASAMVPNTLAASACSSRCTDALCGDVAYRKALSEDDEFAPRAMICEP